MRDSRKYWQIQVQGQVYEAELEELKQWIIEGSVSPSDNVRRGDLRWLPAEKVPALYKFFGSENAVSRISPVVSAGNFQPSIQRRGTEGFSVPQNNFNNSPVVSLNGNSDNSPTAAADNDEINERSDKRFCYWHKETPTEYACDICENYFCKNCPKSFGGSVKLCPLCGSLCRGIDEPVDVQNLIGTVRKPYTQADEPALESESRPQIPGLWKSLAGSLKYCKNSIYRASKNKPF